MFIKCDFIILLLQAFFADYHV